MLEENFISMVGTIIVILLGVIAYFLMDFVNEVKELKKAVILLQIKLTSDQAAIGAWRESEVEKHNTISDRLTRHGERLDTHDIEIAELRTKTNYYAK